MSPNTSARCPHLHYTHLPPHTSPPHTPHLTPNPPPPQVVEPSEVEASYQALAGPLGEEMRSTLAFTAPATGQYAMTAAFFRAAAKHVQDSPSALYRLVPQADIAGRGAKVSGYRLQRQLADLLLPDTLAALGGANAGLLGVDCKEEFSQVRGGLLCCGMGWLQCWRMYSDAMCITVLVPLEPQPVWCTLQHDYGEHPGNRSGSPLPLACHLLRSRAARCPSCRCLALPRGTQWRRTTLWVTSWSSPAHGWR